MATHLQMDGERLLVLRIDGILRRADLDAFQRAAANLLRQVGKKVEALIILNAFEGWERSDQWGDVSFLVEHDADIEKIAIVGEERWRDEALMFTAAGLREGPVRYFTDVDSARAWLAE
jgi:hypothetical protein